MVSTATIARTAYWTKSLGLRREAFVKELVDRYAADLESADNVRRVAGDIPNWLDAKLLKSERSAVIKTEVLRRQLWRVTDSRRLIGCGRYRLGAMVDVVPGPGGPQFRGLESCGSVWSCPSCAGRIRGARAAQLAAGYVAWLGDDADGAAPGAEFLTLTMSHEKSDDLKSLWDVVAKCWGSVVHSKAWKMRCRKLQLLSFVKATEVTYGEHGWHVHLHVVVLFAAKLDHVERDTFREDVADSWGRRVEGLGFSFNPGPGIDVRPLGTKEQAEHVAHYMSGVKAANEQMRGDAKMGRSVSLSPFEILERAASGDDTYKALWHEWETASHGRRAHTFSRGAAVILAAPEEDPTIESLEDPDAPPLATVGSLDWDGVVLRHPRGHVSVLEAAGIAGQAGVDLAVGWLRDDLEGWAVTSHWSEAPPVRPEQLELLPT
jgi:hypothetical protein